jgi:long-chain acyl-CoA synthetase
MEMLPTWLANNGENKDMTLAEATTNATVLAEIQRAVDLANTKVSRAESIRKFVLLPTELTEASGHLTPKLSIKRHVIVQDFADVIDSMYEKAPTTEGVPLQH